MIGGSTLLINWAGYLVSCSLAGALLYVVDMVVFMSSGMCVHG